MKDLRKKETLFKALANYRRLKILKILLEEKKLPVSEIAQNINLSFKSTSKHLSVLEKAGLLSKSQKSLWVFYSIDKDKETLVKRLLDLGV